MANTIIEIIVFTLNVKTTSCGTKIVKTRESLCNTVTKVQVQLLETLASNYFSLCTTLHYTTLQHFATRHGHCCRFLF